MIAQELPGVERADWPTCDATVAASAASVGGSMAKTISVHSFRGGTGKSNVVANLGAQLAASGARVAVIDTDIQSPGVHVLFGLDNTDPRSTISSGNGPRSRMSRSMLVTG
jgi:Mrp family chromosome partitioning ATPase